MKKKKKANEQMRYHKQKADAFIFFRFFFMQSFSFKLAPRKQRKILSILNALENLLTKNLCNVNKTYAILKFMRSETKKNFLCVTKKKISCD